MPSGFQVLKYHFRYVQVNEITSYQVPREETFINLTTLVNRSIAHHKSHSLTWHMYTLICNKNNFDKFMQIIRGLTGMNSLLLPLLVWCVSLASPQLSAGGSSLSPDPAPGSSKACRWLHHHRHHHHRNGDHWIHRSNKTYKLNCWYECYI